jgi:hypothetical protein
LRYFSLYFPVSPDEKIFTTRDEKANPVISFSGSTWEPFIQVLPEGYFKAEPWHKQILPSCSQVLPGNPLFRFYLKNILRQNLKYCVPRLCPGTSEIKLMGQSLGLKLTKE